jgi:chromosome segregation protein
MRLKTLELNGFKSFSKKTVLEFENSIVSIVGPNGSGKSNVVEAIRYVLGEQSMKSMRGKSGADLIFKGSKSLPKGSRAIVTIYFNNSDKIFKLENSEGENINLNYETISISREVYSDGLNKYILNGTEVRLKDIHNLLASVNIGSSGHHIISQGEADRILNASPKDRKEMVEDALGLKIYQYKIKESERKLERTENNMREVTMLRRENAPHLNFLKKQVEKFEKVKEMQIELATFYREYLKKESVYLEKEESILLTERNKLKSELENVANKISITEDNNSTKGNKKIDELRVAEGSLNSIRGVKSEMERKLGRIEGMVEMEGRRAEQNREVVEISQEEIKSIIGDINRGIEEAISKDDVREVKPILERIKNILRKFSSQNTEKAGANIEVEKLKKNQQEILEEMKKIENKEKEIGSRVELLKQEINKEMEDLRDIEREKFTWKVKQQELSSALELVNIKEESLKARSDAFENEIKEGVALIGQEILAYKNEVGESLASATTQEELRRKIERLKIKLEDAGMGGGAEVAKEFKEVSERDQFLAKEMEDLTKSIESLQKLIIDLKEKIDIEFKEGIKKINVEFQEFFSLMFGGGTGSLSVVVENKKKKNIPDELAEEIDTEEEDEIIFEQGIEINVSLPHKKVKELHALSGGERSLTSIALLFAMSQVNPPPFLVLDETDAALDEANSRKYGDMLEKLSHHSQLIVVTHNRETMSRAGVLYGITIGSDGASKLLSVKFDEATAIAK